MNKIFPLVSGLVLVACTLYFKPNSFFFALSWSSSFDDIAYGLVAFNVLGLVIFSFKQSKNDFNIVWFMPTMGMAIFKFTGLFIAAIVSMKMPVLFRLLLPLGFVTLQVVAMCMMVKSKNSASISVVSIFVAFLPLLIQHMGLAK